MGRDKGPPKCGKGAAAASVATKGGAPVELSLRPDECPICSDDVAISEEQHVLGTCGACGRRPYHIDCVQEHLEKTLRPLIREGGYGTKAWEKVQQKIKQRPCDMFATNGTSQRLPVNCPACKTGVMLAADMVKPVRKLTPAPPVAPPRQPRSQQPQPAAAAPTSKKGPITPSPSSSTHARQQAAAARAALAGSSAGNRSGSGLARAGSAASSSGGGYASAATRPDPIPSRPARLRLCNSVLEDERCYVYNCPFCHSVEEQQEREAEYLEEQKEAARKRRAAELEQYKREQEQGEREQRQQAQAAAAAAHEEEQVEVAAAVQASVAAAEERQAAMRRDMLAREEASLQLSHDALGLMKRHKRQACIASLTEIGYSGAHAAAAAEAAACEPAAAAILLVDGGLRSGMVPIAVSVIREARELLAEAAKLGLPPPAVEAAVVAAAGDWEQARWELQQAQHAAERAAQALSTAGGAASSAGAAPTTTATPAHMSRQSSTASMQPPSSEPLGGSWAGVLLAPAAAALPAGSAASSSNALKDWGSSDPQLASATSAWLQPDAQPAGALGAGPSTIFDSGFAAGSAAALQGVQPQAGAFTAAAALNNHAGALAALEPDAELAATQGWAGGVPPPQERPLASDAEVDALMAFLS